MSPLWFSTAMQLSLGEDERFKILSDILIENNAIVAGAKLSSYSVMASDTARFSRTRKLKKESLGELISNCCKSAISAIHLYSSQASASNDTPEITVSIDTLPSSRTRYLLIIDGPRIMCDQDALIMTCEHLTKSFRVAYGSIIAGEFDYVSSLTSWIPIGSVEDFYEELKHGRKNTPKRMFEDEVLFYQLLQDKFHEKIPRAAWGNILSPEHISGLGGEERIRRESGCFLVERWGSNLYLQLTESIWQVSNDDLLRLNDYFTPIRFPDAPEPVYLSPEDAII